MLWKENSSYISLVKDDWSKQTVPWYCKLLRQFIPDSFIIEQRMIGSKAVNFIHEDFTLSNIFLDNDGKIIVLNYENASLEPALWDETTLVYSLVESNQYESAIHLYKEFACGAEKLYAL